MNESLASSVLWLIVWSVPLVVLASLAYYIVSLPLRRQERARFFLDLVETGLQEGRNLEQTLIAISHTRDLSVGVRFHLLAAYLEKGLRLEEALKKVPQFLPAQVTAMLAVGAEIGDLRKVLPACRQVVKDGTSQTRGALNYLVVLAFVLTPLAPVCFTMLAVFVFPKFLLILQDMEVPVPALTVYVVDHSLSLAGILIAAALSLYLIAFFFVVGPRVASWFRVYSFPLSDWIAYRLPWRRKRMQRDFSAMAAILLDAAVPEPRAIALAANSTANQIVIGRSNLAIADLRAGKSLPEAMRRLDDSGELHWRLTNALHARNGFRAALGGWLETLDAKAFQQEQAAAQTITTACVFLNGLMVGLITAGTFSALIAIIDAGVLW
jgi:type II secretory pathway component PulF